MLVEGSRWMSLFSIQGIQTARCSKWFIYVVVNLAVFTDAYLYGLIIPVLPFALTEYVSIPQDEVQTWIGILLGSYGGGLLVGSPVAGYLADNGTSRRGPYMLGLVALAGSTAMFSFGRPIALLVVARLVQGASSGFVHSIGVSILADTVGDSAIGRAMGFVSLSIAAGLVTGPICGGILYHRFGYQAVFVSAYGVIALDFLFRILMIEQPHSAKNPVPDIANGAMHAGPLYGTFLPQDTHSGTSDGETGSANATPASPSTSTLRSATQSIDTMTKFPPLDSPPSRPSFVILLTNPRSLVAILGSFMEAFILTVLETLLPLHLKDLFHMNSSQIGSIFFLLLICSFFAPLIGHLSDRVGPKLTVSTGFTLLAPLLILLRLVHQDTLTATSTSSVALAFFSLDDQGAIYPTSQLVLLCILLFFIGLALNLILTPVFTETKEAVDELEARQPGIFGEGGAYAIGFALMNMAYAAGSLVGPMLGSVMVGRIGWEGVVTVVGGACAVCVVPSIWAVGGKIERKWWTRVRLVHDETNSVRDGHVND